MYTVKKWAGGGSRDFRQCVILNAEKTKKKKSGRQQGKTKMTTVNFDKDSGGGKIKGRRILNPQE